MGLFALSHLKNELERLLGCSVDIVRLREHMNAALHKRIEKEGTLCMIRNWSERPYSC